MDGTKHVGLKGLGKDLKDRFRIEYGLKNIRTKQGELKQESVVLRKINE